MAQGQVIWDDPKVVWDDPKVQWDRPAFELLVPPPISKPQLKMKPSALGYLGALLPERKEPSAVASGPNAPVKSFDQLLEEAKEEKRREEIHTGPPRIAGPEDFPAQRPQYVGPMVPSGPRTEVKPAHGPAVTELAETPLLPVGKAVRFLRERAPAEEMLAPEHNIARGILGMLSSTGQVGADVIEGLSTPVNLALLGGIIAAPAIGIPTLALQLGGGVFAVAMAKNAGQRLSEAYDLYLKGDIVGAGEQVAGAGVDTIFALLAGKPFAKTALRAPIGERPAMPQTEASKARASETVQPPPETTSPIAPVAERPITPTPESVAQPEWTTAQETPIQVRAESLRPPKPKVGSLPRKGKALLSADRIADFDSSRDVVERRGNRTFVVDKSGQYASREVKSDILTPEFQANLGKLTPEQRERMAQTIEQTPYLSKEGKAERLAILRPAPGEAPTHPPIPAPEGTVGLETTLRTVAGDQPARYRVVEADSLEPSHNPMTFQPNSGYPKGVQPRQYQTNKSAQMDVISIARKPDFAQLINTDPTAISGPPQVSPGGIVIGGNTRTMALQRIYRSSQGKDYKVFLEGNSEQFGINPAAVRAMRKPVLVRELSDAPTEPAAMARLAQDLNRPFTKPLAEVEAAVSAGQRLTPESVNAIVGELTKGEEAGTLRDAMASNPGLFRDALLRDGVLAERELPRYFTNEGAVNTAGKDFIENALLGKIVPDADLLQGLPKSISNKLERAIPSLVELGSRADSWNILPEVIEAARMAARAQAKGWSVEKFIRQGDIFEQPDERVQAIAELFTKTPTKVANSFKQFAGEARAAEGGQMFEGAFDPVEAFGRIIRGSNPREAKLAAQIGKHLIPPGPKLYSMGIDLAEMGKAVRALGTLIKGEGPENLRVGTVERGIIREKTGEFARAKEQLFYDLKPLIDIGSKFTTAESLDFIDRMESGAPQVNHSSQHIATALRRLLENRKEAVQNLGTGKLENFIENYFPHIWENPTRAGDVFKRILGAKRPLQGPASFLRKRTIPTTAEGVAAGLNPVTYNPVTLTLLKVVEMDRYIMAHKLLNDMKDSGLAKFVRFGVKAPDDWVPLEDRMFRVLQYSEAEEGFIIRGSYYAPAEAAKSLNRYTSPGLMGSPTYQGLRKYGNLLNQVQLGMSAFHLAFTSMDAITSDLSVALQRISRGEIGRAIAPTMRAATLTSPVSNYLKGNRLLKEYLSPGSYADMTKTADFLTKAGGRVFMDPFYKSNSIRAFQRSWKATKEFAGSGQHGKAVGQAGRTILRSFSALAELLAKPIMENVVPRQKLGVFANLAEDVARQYGDTPEVLRYRLNQAWDSVDNRMGQLVYDNLFWNRTLKDLGMISVRSLGWNIGTARELGGAALDAGKQAGRIMAGLKPEITNRIAYAVALPVVTAYVGAITTYLVTGRGPDDLIDYFYPPNGGKKPNGEDSRWSLPSYIRDVYGFYKNPLSTGAHKIHPAIQQMNDMLRNKDFYGTEIRHPDDPLVKQAEDITEYLAKSFEPFSFRNLSEARRELQGTGKGIASFFGLTPAPYYVGQSKAEEMASERSAGLYPQGPRTKEQFERSQKIRQLENQLDLKQITTQEVRVKASKHEITQDQARRIIREARIPVLSRRFQSLSIEDALDVYKVATPEERKFLRIPLQNKRKNALKSRTPDEVRELNRRYFEAIRSTSQQPTPQSEWEIVSEAPMQQ